MPRAMTRPYVVSDFASPAAHTIGKGKSLADAHRLMRAHRVRHLPVLDGRTLAGIVSQRDLYRFETLDAVDQEKVTVAEAMTPNPYLVKRDAPLRSVAAEMWKRGLGSAVVVNGGKAVGIFTASDALHALVDLLTPPARKRPAGVRNVAPRAR